MSRTEMSVSPMRVAEGLPLSSVPLERGVSFGDIDVAGHELNHALAAYSLDVPVLSISIVPQGNSLGRTVFGGSLSADQLKIIAAAGSVPTTIGAASGYGSDLYKAHMLATHFGGMSVGSAQDHASGLVSSYPFEVRKKAAEIIAYLKNVPGAWLPVIMARAAAEVDLAEGNDFFISEELMNIENEIPLDSIENMTVIDELGDGTSKVTVVEEGLLVDEKIICNLCFGENGHFPNCPITNKEEADILVGDDSLFD